MHLLSIVSILATAASLLGNHAGPIAYTLGSTGYDISYPQCGSNLPAGAFGIVGVNGGYPFVYYNPCLAAEYAHSSNAALYINTGYDRLYAQVARRYTTKGCSAKSALIRGTAERKSAWGVGCSEASRSIAYATSQGIARPSSWWLDVETENSWSSNDRSLNQYTIQGIVDTLRRSSRAAVGIYSTGYQWHKSPAACRCPACGPTGRLPAAPRLKMPRPIVASASRAHLYGSCNTSRADSTLFTAAKFESR